MKKKNIHLVHYNSVPGGIEVLLPRLINSMNCFRFFVFVIRPPKKNLPNVYENIYIDITYGSNGIGALIKFFFYSLKYKNDTFHVFNIGPYFLLLLRIAGVKNVIYSIHGTKYWNNSFQKFIRKIIWRFSIAKNYIFTANSIHSATVFKRHVLNKEVIVLYNPIDISRFSIVKKERKIGVKNIIYMGRFSPGKNLELWIDVANFIIRNNPNYIFNIYGIGPLRDHLQQKIDKLKINKYIKLKGFTSNPEYIYQSADIMLFLSQYESFGNVVVESILCGTPVICSDIPAFREIFNNAPEFLVDIRTDKEIVFKNIYKKILNLDKLREKTFKINNEFKIRFGHDVFYKSIKKLYNSLPLRD